MNEETLAQVRADILGSELKNMYPSVDNIVPGEGSNKAEIMFVGEAPGAQEDQEGKPFVGRAGKFLNEMLATIGLDREDVYITNIVKCRPPENRDPTDEEKDLWYPFLERQVRAIKPLVIATLGRHSMGHFIPGVKISQVHGSPKRGPGIWSDRQIYLPLYHPAAALYNGGQRQTLIDDFSQIPELIKKIKSEDIYAEL